MLEVAAICIKVTDFSALSVVIRANRSIVCPTFATLVARLIFKSESTTTVLKFTRSFDAFAVLVSNVWSLDLSPNELPYRHSPR